MNKGSNIYNQHKGAKYVFWIPASDKESNPVSLDDLKRLFMEGAVNADTSVREEGSPHWTRLGAIFPDLARSPESKENKVSNFDRMRISIKEIRLNTCYSTLRTVLSVAFYIGFGVALLCLLATLFAPMNIEIKATFSLISILCMVACVAVRQATLILVDIADILNHIRTEARN